MSGEGVRGLDGPCFETEIRCAVGCIGSWLLSCAHELHLDFEIQECAACGDRLRINVALTDPPVPAWRELIAAGPVPSRRALPGGHHRGLRVDKPPPESLGTTAGGRAGRNGS